MISTSPALVLLADLHALGIDVQAAGGAIRFRPRHAMTPDLLQRLAANKQELLRLLDTENAVAELRRYVAALWQDYAWRDSWERRFQEAQYASLDSLRSVLGVILDDAEEQHRRRDWRAFDSACKYLRRLASGEMWDDAKPMTDPARWTIMPPYTRAENILGGELTI